MLKKNEFESMAIFSYHFFSLLVGSSKANKGSVLFVVVLKELAILVKKKSANETPIVLQI